MPNLAHWTREQVLALPDDGNRYEHFDGELVVTPSPGVPHQLVVTSLVERFLLYLLQFPVARLMMAPADLRLDGNQVAQPDVFVWPGRIVPRGWDAAPLPILAIEVTSPSSAHYDRAFKRRYYQRARVAEYWVVDGNARLVERWRPGDDRPEVLDREIAWQPAPNVAPLVIDLPAMFRELRDDP